MSAKPEQARAPAIVSHADTGPTPQQPHPLQHQPHPPNYHQGQIIYQQPYGQLPHYQQQGPPVWNQPPQTTVHFVQYAPQQENPTFQDNKVQSYNHYGTVHFAQPGMDNGDMMMRGPQTAYVPQQYVTSPQWFSTGQQNQGQFIPTYATTFNVANDPTYHPNHPMNRPNPGRQNDYQGGNDSANYMQFVPFVAPIGVMESQAHASASYTANWVSSTSSIPPEMKDEPESDNISQYDSQRPTSQMNGDNWTDHEDHLSPSTTQQSFTLPTQPRPMPYVEKEKSPSQSTTKTSKSAKGEKTEGKRELTFDERIEKARMQKTRVENETANREAEPNASSATAPTSGTVASSTPVQTPRSYGHRKEYSGYNNNSNNYNMNNRGRGGGHHYNGNNSHNEMSGAEHYHQQQHAHQQQYYQQQQQPLYEHVGQAIDERDTYNSKRDNSYNTNRFENNQHNASYNQKHVQNQNQGQNQNQHQNQNHAQNHGRNQNHGQNQNQNQYQNQQGQEFNRQPSYRGRGRGGYRGGYQQQGVPQQNQQQPIQDLSRFVGAPQVMSTQMLATINAFQNAQISNLPRIPLLPGPFGMPRHAQLHQDVKFHNTWLDAASCPMPLAAVMTMDTRYGNRSGGGNTYRGRGRGGYGYRGGHRGGAAGGNAGYVNPTPKITVKVPDITAENPPKEETAKPPSDEKESVAEETVKVEMKDEVVEKPTSEPEPKEEKKATTPEKPSEVEKTPAETEQKAEISAEKKDSE